MFRLFKNIPTVPSNAVLAVASGELIPIENVKDEVFSQKMLGDGVAIVPSDDLIVAPCDGKITMLYPTLHAFGIQKKDGLEILVHIGINTVELNGKGFKNYVSNGDEVRAGDKIIRVDSYFLKNEGFDTTIMVLYPNCPYSLNIKRSGFIRKARSIITTYQ